MSRKRSILSATLLTIVAFASGLKVGSHRLSQSIPENRERIQSLSEYKTNHPPPSPHRKTTPGSEKREPPKIRSLEEIKAVLAEITTRKLPDRFNAIDDLVASVDPTDLPAVLELAEKTSPDAFRAKLRESLLEHWAESDPKVAMAWAAKIPGLQQRQEAMLAVLNKWAEVDSTSAADWVKQLPLGTLRQRALEQLVSSENDPDKAIAFLESFGIPLDRFRDSAQNIFNTLARLDPRAAAAKAAALPHGGFRQNALQAVASTWAATDPLSALEWSKSLPEASERLQSLNGIVTAWGEGDPRKVPKADRCRPRSRAPGKAYFFSPACHRAT
jgi:hypothetical protein